MIEPVEEILEPAMEKALSIGLMIIAGIAAAGGVMNFRDALALRRKKEEKPKSR